MTIYWPDNLRLPIQYGATNTFGKGAKISSDMDAGNRKRRQRFTRVPVYQSIKVRYTDEEMDRFLTFYRSVLMNGVASFQAKVIVGTNVEYRRCTINDDSLDVTYSDYNSNEVSMELEIYDISGTGGDVEYIVGLYGEDFAVNEFMDPLDNIVNVLYPDVMEDY